MLLHLDPTTPDMTQAEMARAEIEARIGRAAGKPLDLADGRLSGPELSGPDLRGASLRLPRLNRTLLRRAARAGRNPSARLSPGADPGANPREADLSWARTRGDFGGANFGGALLAGRRGGAAIRNVDASGARLRQLKGRDETLNCDAPAANRAVPAH